MKLAKIAFVVMITLIVIGLGFNIAVAACTTQGFEVTSPEGGDIIRGDDYEIRMQ